MAGKETGVVLTLDLLCDPKAVKFLAATGTEMQGGGKDCSLYGD